MQNEMEAKNITLDVDLATEPVIIQADPVRMKQIAWNLLSNASKFTPSGGSVELIARGAPGGIEVIVKDTGKGIAPDIVIDPPKEDPPKPGTPTPSEAELQKKDVQLQRALDILKAQRILEKGKPTAAKAS